MKYVRFCASCGAAGATFTWKLYQRTGMQPYQRLGCKCECWTMLSFPVYDDIKPD